MVRTTILIALIVLIFLWVCYHALATSTFYVGLQVFEKINFWVAVGTIALAIFTAALAGVTTFSVRETQALLRAEDIRHQEQYAPFLSLEFTKDYQREARFSLVRGFQLSSKGLGPSIVTGYEISGTYHRPEFVQKTDVFALEPGEELKLDLNVSGISWYITAAEPIGVSLKEFEYERGRAPGGVPDIYVHMGSVVLFYKDIFGNPYRTVYEDYGQGSYRWVKPHIEARKLMA